MSRLSPVRQASGRNDGLWVACRCCRADDCIPFLIGEDRLLGLAGSFQVVRCRGCGFLYTNPQPDEATLGRHYPPDYHASPEPSVLGPPRPGAGLRARLLAGLLAERGYPGSSGRVGSLWRSTGSLAGRLFAERFFWMPPFVAGGLLVDVGCGTGGYLAEMRELGWTVIGFEPSAGAGEAARERFGLDVRIATLEGADFADGSADVVTMRMVLEHVRDPRATLSEVHRILKPGGRLLLSVPNAGSLETRAFGPHWRGWELPRHLSHFTPRTLRALLEEMGFTSVDIRHLANANNLAASLHFRRGGMGSPGQPRLLLRLTGLLAASVRTAGRIAAEARVPSAQEREAGPA